MGKKIQLQKEKSWTNSGYIEAVIFLGSRTNIIQITFARRYSFIDTALSCLPHNSKPDAPEIHKLALVVKNMSVNAGEIKKPLRTHAPKDLLEEGMATYSSILAWRISGTEEPGSYSPWGPQELETTESI